jgi:DNA polymerase-1
MKTLLDQEGLIEGLNIMTRNIACTKIITYLATNTTAGNKLGLKYQSHEYAGNYGEDVTDIRNLTLGNLMKYNIMDCICTWYVHNKHWPTLVADNQERVYNEIMIKSIKVIVQMELTGACVDMGKVLDAEKKLEKEMSLCSIGINMHPIVQDVIKYKKAEQLLVDNAKLKTKERQWDELGHIDFNPNSSKDLQILFHEVLDYPVIDRTPTKMPATGAKTINKHIGALMDEVHRGLFESLVGVAQISIILNNFIKNFKEARLGEDGMHYLFGNFNLGGTVSGRLSSSQPNMQNIPSTGSKYAKMIKECFVAPEGWIFCGADFASLEDRISALLTKDTNKLKVYTDGFDGHAYRAYHYYPSEYVGISLTPESINGTVKTHKKWRQKSKTPTFLLTYGGTYIGIMEQTGMTMIEAKTIEANYHTLYAESDAWVQEQVKEASNTGYVECAFGLRVRTPILKQTLFNTQVTPYEAMKEGRTAGNALGQSWGMLNNRAAIALQETVLASEFALDIRPSMHIHDAQYFLVRDELDVVEFLNNELGKEMSWQDDPKIQHDVVSLSGDLDLFHPHWGESVTLPNYAKPLEIEDLVESHLSKLSGSNKVS